MYSGDTVDCIDLQPSMLFLLYVTLMGEGRYTPKRGVNSLAQERTIHNLQTNERASSYKGNHKAFPHS